MCGIAGFVTNGNGQPDAALLRAMCDRIAHRGPDGYGEFLDERAALGHRRLSIIDLEGGAQPMGNEDGSLQVIFNGEIYNYLELKKDLAARGHVFATRSDTEVLVHLYEEVGERLPEHLNGMFALAIWDRRKSELFLARDRFGKKPLYVTFGAPGCRVAFASELKALTALPGLDLEIRPESVADFLAFSYVPEPHTIYKRVEKLEAGGSLLVAGSRENRRRYWRLSFDPAPGAPRRIEEAQERLDEIASDSVRRRLMSDVPLGAFLSGGVDSSAVVSYMSRHAPGRVKTFSIGFTNEAFNETGYARTVARQYETEHFERTVTPDISEMLPVLVKHFDEPFGDSSAVPTLYLSRMTRERVTVALAGDGADELLGGYRRHWLGVVEARGRAALPGALRRPVFSFLGRMWPKFDYLPQPMRFKTTFQNLGVDLPDAYFTTMTTFRDEALRTALAPELNASLNGYDPREGWRDRFSRYAHLPALLQMQAIDVETYLPGDILVKADRATMAYSLEGRAPWMDYRMGELVSPLPPEWKLKGRQGKYFFKRMLSDRLPGDVLWRPKMGFAVPLASWFRTSLKERFEREVIAAGPAHLLRREEASRLWGEHQSGLHDHSRKLWNLLMLAAWWSEHAA